MEAARSFGEFAERVRVLARGRDARGSPVARSNAIAGCEAKPHGTASLGDEGFGNFYIMW